MGLVQNRKNEISSTAVDMIHAQKFNCCFSTTYTFSLIMSLFNSESDPGTYDITNKAYDTEEARITVLDNLKTSTSQDISRTCVCLALSILLL
jgi:hypothetical protein